MSLPVPDTDWATPEALPSDGPPPPPPGFLETVAAGFRTARADTTGFDEGERLTAYAPVMDALADLGYPAGAFVNPARGTVSAEGVWRAVQAEKRKGHFKDLPETFEEFDTAWRQRSRASIAADEATVSRGNGLAAFAGGVAGAMTDPVNLYTLPFGGAGATVTRRIAGEVAANVAVETFQQPIIQGQRERQGRRDLTIEEAATNVAFAGVGAGVLRGGIEVAGKVPGALRSAIDAGLDRLPEPLRDRYMAAKLAGADPLDDEVLLADLTEAVVGRENMAEHEASAVDVLRREGELAQASPFVRSGGGTAIHDALMADTFSRVLSENPFRPTAPLLEARRAGPAAPVRVAAGGAEAGFMARVRRAESGGDDAARNPRSSATGRYQFTDGTWLAYYKRRFGGGLSDRAILAKRGDGRMQDLLMEDLTADNAAFLRSRGEAVTEGNLYLAHFAGQGGARKVFDADPAAPIEAVLGRGVVDANPFLRGKTAGWIIRWAHQKMDGTPPRRGGARVEADPASGLATTEAEGLRIQQALDDTVARADALDEAQRASRAGELTVEQYVDAHVAGRWGDTGPPAEVEPFATANAAAIEAEFAARAEAPPAPIDVPDLRARDAGLPDSGPDLTPALRAIVRDTKRSLANIEGIAGEVGASVDAVRRALTQMAEAGELRFVQRQADRQRVKNAQGRWRTKTPQEIAAESGGVWSGGFARAMGSRGREDVWAFIARQGGIEPNGLGAAEIARRTRDGTPIKGHDLRNTAGLANMMVPAMGPILRPTGKSLDEIGEALWDAGFFGPPDMVARPGETEVLALLSDLSTSGGKRYSFFEGEGAIDADAPTNAYDDFLRKSAEEDRAAFGEAWRADQEAVYGSRPERALDEVASYAEDAPFVIDTAFRLWKDGLNPEEALDEAVRIEYASIARATADETADESYIPWDGDDAAEADPAFLRWLDGDEPDPDGVGRAGDPGNAGTRGGPGESPEAGGARLAELPAAARAAFLDPDSDVAKAQADSLAHDARMLLPDSTDPAIAERQAQEAQLRVEAPMRSTSEQDGTLGLSLFDAGDLPTFRLDAEGDPVDLSELMDAIDLDEAELKQIRDCL